MRLGRWLRSPQMVAYPVSAGCLGGPDGSAFAGRLMLVTARPDPSTRWNNPTIRSGDRTHHGFQWPGPGDGNPPSIERNKPPADLPQVLHIPASSPRQELPALTSHFVRRNCLRVVGVCRIAWMAVLPPGPRMESPWAPPRRRSWSIDADLTGMRRTDVRDIVQLFLDGMVEELADGNRLEFRTLVSSK